MSFKTLGKSVLSTIQGVLGDDVIYTPNGGDPVTIKGVFDNAWVEVEGVISLRPTLRINLSDLEESPGKGDTVLIDDTSYRVTESRLDGFGGSTLILQRY